MNVNADFTRRVVVHSEDLPWQDSPMPGVKRRMLDRVGGEVARATSIVSYAPNSQFAPHVHAGGEEYMVLNGVFQDEHGDFATGSYVRNPPQSQHTPGSKEGCIIFVKLWQFDLSDRQEIHQQIGDFSSLENDRDQVVHHSLFKDHREHVELAYWSAGSSVVVEAEGGLEALVLEGGFEEGKDRLSRHSWIRIPDGGHLRAMVGETGAKVWIKTGHLRYVNDEINALRQ